MIPAYFNDIKSNYKKYFDDQYPLAEDCKILDQQILSIQKDIDELNKRILKNPDERSSEDIKKDTKLCTLLGNNVANNLTCIVGRKNIAKQVRTDSLNYLKKLLQSKQNSYALGDCRNKTELVRQEETAAVFSETSAKQETQVLTQSKSKQYLLIGVGSILLVTTLVVVLIKRK